MRSIPDPGFAGDDGATAPEVAEALAALAALDRLPAGSREAELRVLAVLQQSRVLVPVVAVLGEVEYDEQGRAVDKSSDMAAVLMTGQDGRRALLAFTGSEAMSRWDPTARPVPVKLPDAARAARHDGAEALLLDVAGPTLFVVESSDLDCLADGRRLVRLGEHWGWAGPN